MHSTVVFIVTVQDKRQTERYYLDVNIGQFKRENSTIGVG
jgi:hypothetical protein